MSLPFNANAFLQTTLSYNTFTQMKKSFQVFFSVLHTILSHSLLLFISISGRFCSFILLFFIFLYTWILFLFRRFLHGWIVVNFLRSHNFFYYVIRRLQYTLAHKSFKQFCESFYKAFFSLFTYT